MPKPDLNRADFEPYFHAWNSVLHYPNPNPLPGTPKIHIHWWTGDAGMIPCHQHRKCGALVWAKTKYPPRICPGCNLNTESEINPDAVPIPADQETGLVVLPPGVERT